jgi:hypothetical protein
MFWATTQAADLIAHEMKNAVHGSLVFGLPQSQEPKREA